MEQHELDLIAKYRDSDEELNTLWEQHLRFERELDKIESKPYLTPGEELEVKDMKKKKLAGKTKIQKILDKYRQQPEA
ncbi:MAG: DUF465 domain-containing protein [Desulfovibrionales bacterium]